MDFGVKNTGSPGQMPYGIGDIAYINRTTEILDQIHLMGRKMGEAIPGIAEHVDTLRKEFKSLPPHMKEFMYRQLTQGDGNLRTQFGKIHPPDSDDLLKILNPKHTRTEPVKGSEAYEMQRLHDYMKEITELEKARKELDKREAEEAKIRFKLEQDLLKNNPTIK